MVALHHQLMYRLQNHALDLPTPHTSINALMILADTELKSTLIIVQILKQIQQDGIKISWCHIWQPRSFYRWHSNAFQSLGIGY